MKKIENYLNYIFSDYPQTGQTEEIKEELKINLIEKFEDYIADGLDEKAAFDKAILSLGDIDELLESFNIKESTNYYSENINEYINEIKTNDEAFRKAMPKISFKVALGVFIILHGLAVAGFLSEAIRNRSINSPFDFDALVSTYFFISIAIGVALFIIAGLSYSKLEFKSVFNAKQISEFEDDQKLTRARLKLKELYNDRINRNNILLVIGIVVTILGVGTTALVESIAPAFVPGYFFTIIGIGVFMIIYAGMNRMMSSELDKSTSKVVTKKADSFSGVIMLCATIIFLISGFVFNNWHPAWIVFPIAGICVGIYETITSSK